MSFSFSRNYMTDAEFVGFKEAIDNFSGIVVCGSGNDYNNIDLAGNYIYPQCYDSPNIIVVGGSDSLDQVWSEEASYNNAGTGELITYTIGSNFGAQNVDLYAPGVDILSTFDESKCSLSGSVHFSNGYHLDSGTSFATPYVTGVAALIMSANPTLNSIEVKNRLMYTVDPISSLSGCCVTGGRLNAYNALRNYHSHNYVAGLTCCDSSTHYVYCICGAYIFDEHLFSYVRYNSSSHTTSCNCGYETQEPHVVRASDIGSSFKYCRYCNALISDAGFGEVGGLALTPIKISSNGSYILPSGIIVLVDEDVEAYENNTLIFYNNNLLIK